MTQTQASKLYENFSDLPADEKFDADIPQPKQLHALGSVIHVVYLSNKWHTREGRTGKKDEFIKYVHDWKTNAPLLCLDKANDYYHLLGKVSVKAEGITDWKGKQINQRKPNYSIPKDLTFLGYLVEIVYTDIESQEDYKIEFGKKSILCSGPSGLSLYIAKIRS
jgi:hypothetical protein